jgi:hypothetical protein
VEFCEDKGNSHGILVQLAQSATKNLGSNVLMENGMKNGKPSHYDCPICNKRIPVGLHYGIVRSGHLKTHGINTAFISPEHRDDPEFMRKYYGATHVSEERAIRILREASVDVSSKEAAILGTDRLLSSEEAVKLMEERGYGTKDDSLVARTGRVLLDLARDNKVRVWLWRDGELKFQYEPASEGK